MFKFSRLFFVIVFCSCASSLGSKHSDASHSSLPESLFQEELSRHAEATDWLPMKKSSAQYLFLRGEMAVENDQVEEAIIFFEKAIAQDPESTIYVRKRLISLYVRLSKLEKALEQLDVVLRREIDNRDLLILRAGILTSLQKTDLAIETYQQLITLGTRDEEPFLLLSSLYAEKNDYKQAQSVLKQLLSHEKESYLGIYYLAKMYEIDEQYSSAEIYYKKALKLSSKSRVVTLDLARVLGFQKKFDEAIALCEDLLILNPKNPEIKKLLSQLLLGDNRFEEAQKQLEDIEGQSGGDPLDTRLKIALIKLQQRDFEGAVVDFSLILAEKPDYSPALYYIASAHASLKKTDAAIDALKAIKPEQEFFLESRTFLSYVYKEEERYDDAVAALEEIFKTRPDNPRVYSLIVTLYRQAKDSKNAIKNLEKLIELEPDVDKHLFLLGVIYEEANDQEKAVECMKKALAINPKNTDVLNYLGYTYAELGINLDEAEKLITEALVIEPANAYFLDSLAWVYYKGEKYEQARVELQKAVASVKDDAVILEHYALVLEKLGERKQAKAVAEQALESVAKSEDSEVGERIRSVLKRLSDVQ